MKTGQPPDDQFDIRDDEEQQVALQNIIDILIAAGYFRARIKNLPVFDKIVGGMVWCISACSETVDVDLFYSDNSTIGQKISTTEKVVEVLHRLKCPHSIEPHQIQGLDYLRIFPVLQWLVAKAVSARSEQDRFTKYGNYQFNQYFPKKDVQTVFEQNIKILRNKCYPRRVYKRVDGFECADLMTDVRCTLMEYGWKNEVPSLRQSGTNEVSPATSDTALDEEIEQLGKQLSAHESHSKKQKVSSKAFVELIKPSESDTAAILFQTSTQLRPVERYLSSDQCTEEELQRLKKELESYDDLIKVSRTTLEERTEKLDAARKRVEKYQQLVESCDETTLTTLKQLLKEHDEIRKCEADFKANCRSELKKLDEELEKLNALSQTDSLSDSDTLSDAESTLSQRRSECANLNYQIAELERILDTSPSKVEITQYQRRIIELYNQTASKHRETKQLYILHNALIDMQKFMQHELDMLNNIEDVQEQAAKESYKESFVENLQKILKGIDAYFDSLSTKQKELEARKEKLSKEYQFLLEKERLFYKTIEDFKIACSENEELRKMLIDGGK